MENGLLSNIPDLKGIEDEQSLGDPTEKQLTHANQLVVRTSSKVLAIRAEADTTDIHGLVCLFIIQNAEVDQSGI